MQVLESRMPRVPVGVAGNMMSVMGTVLPGWVANVPICTLWRAMEGPARTGVSVNTGASTRDYSHARE